MVPAGSSSVAEAADAAPTPPKRWVITTPNATTPTMIITPMTTVKIFNARIPLPLPWRAGYPNAMSTEPPAAIPVIATESDRGKRIDRFLAEALAATSRSRLKVLIEDGHVTRDGQPMREPAEAVRPGAVYLVTEPPPLPATPQGQAMDLTILYEDSDLIVLDKQAGLVVHPAPGNYDGTLVNALIAHCGDSLTGIGAERRPGIVHRLDKDTSGVMVVAKTELANAALTQAFAARDLDRAYLALVWGLPNPVSGDIEGAIGRDPRERKRMAVRGIGGKYALTHYRTLANHAMNATLLECRLATGRTHQIRVHLANAGNPLVGDPVYLRRIPAAAKGLPTELRGALLDFPRQALHATRLGFVHPRDGKYLSFTTAPPTDMLELFSLLEFNPAAWEKLSRT